MLTPSRRASSSFETRGSPSGGADRSSTASEIVCHASDRSSGWSLLLQSAHRFWRRGLGEGGQGRCEVMPSRTSHTRPVGQWLQHPNHDYFAKSQISAVCGCEGLKFRIVAASGPGIWQSTRRPRRRPPPCPRATGSESLPPIATLHGSVTSPVAVDVRCEFHACISRGHRPVSMIPVHLADGPAQASSRLLDGEPI